MSKKPIESTRANPRQMSIDAEAEIRGLSLSELHHIAGGQVSLTYSHIEFTYTVQKADQ
jgi:hypothetical protein